MENQDKKADSEETIDPVNNDNATDKLQDGENIQALTDQDADMPYEKKDHDDHADTDLEDEVGSFSDQNTAIDQDTVGDDVVDFSPEEGAVVAEIGEENKTKKKKLKQKKAKILQAFARVSKKLEKDIVKEKKGAEKLSQFKTQIKTIKKDLSRKTKKKQKKELTKTLKGLKEKLKKRNSKLKKLKTKINSKLKNLDKMKSELSEKI